MRLQAFDEVLSVQLFGKVFNLLAHSPNGVIQTIKCQKDASSMEQDKIKSATAQL